MWHLKIYSKHRFQNLGQNRKVWQLLAKNVDMYVRSSNESIENTPFSSLQLSNINQQTESYSTINKQDCQSKREQPSGILKVLRDKPLIDILNMTKSTLNSRCAGGQTKEVNRSTSRSRSKNTVFGRLYQQAALSNKNGILKWFFPLKSWYFDTILTDSNCRLVQRQKSQLHK